MIRLFTILILLTSFVRAEPGPKVIPLPIDPLWKSAHFRKSVTGSFGIDSRIEPRITVDEEFYLDESAKKMADEDREAAIKILSESSLLEKSPAMQFSLATFQFEAGDHESAVAHFSKALELFPNFRDAHRNLAIVLVQQEKFKEAIEHLGRSLELGSRESITMGLLGYCHAVQGHHQAALDAYRLAALTQPSERQWKMGESQALQSLNRPKDAASILQQLIDDDPKDLNLWLVQADNWIALGKPVAAIANLEMAYRAEKLSGEATLSLGHLYLQNGLPAIALERYQLALKQSDRPVPLHRAVEALELFGNRGDWKRASTLATQITSSETLNTEIESEEMDKKVLSRFHRQQALIELEIGDAKAGAKLIEDWLTQEPMDGLALILLARFKEEDDAREEAEMLLERAEQLPEQAAEAHLSHGKLLVSVGEYAAAIKHLELSLDLKDSKIVSDYLEAVRELAP